MKCPIAAALSHIPKPTFAAVAVPCGSDRISGWRIAPPMFAAFAIRPTVTTERSRMIDKVPRPKREFRRNCHSPNQAAAPIISINTYASSAAFWCSTINVADTPGRFLIANWAALPLRYAGIVKRATPKKIIRPARFKSSLFPTMEHRNRPRPIIVPMTGKWFSKRCTCGRFITRLPSLVCPTGRRIPSGGIRNLLENSVGHVWLGEGLSIGDNCGHKYPAVTTRFGDAIKILLHHGVGAVGNAVFSQIPREHMSGDHLHIASGRSRGHFGGPTLGSSWNSFP